ncbi:nodulation protein NolU [Bradyrhizobium xenonodulans]|uniref:Nodulation protein NolU n=1 Tax=Bradyrhizobium xenonodulans TaxID=2736875 RepID=A0ABY7MSR4_9BRAD|nr:nodulation protein NolU [Bradyrhizobium xenonodulans]WBL81364.1 nodulation protein NolU [Bradyrhizobium xenonodulans]
MSDAGNCTTPPTAAKGPLPLLHPSRIASALDRRLTLETARRLQNCPRLHDRLAAQIQPFLTQQDLWPLPDTADFIAMPADLEHIARRAGAVWHAASLRLVVTGKAASSLVGMIGETAFTFGLRHAAAAIAPAQSLDPSDLAEAIERDGFACLGAWLAIEPKPRRDAVLLRLTPVQAGYTRLFSLNHPAAARAVMDIVMAEEDVS